MTDEERWAEAFARLSPADQEQALADQVLFGRAVIYTAPSPDGRTIRVRPDAIIDIRDASWNRAYNSIEDQSE